MKQCPSEVKYKICSKRYDTDHKKEYYHFNQRPIRMIRVAGDDSCQFKHPDETIGEYYLRTSTVKPDLPETSEKTRNPESTEQEVKKGSTIELRKKPKYRQERRERQERENRQATQEQHATQERLSERILIHVPSSMKKEALEMCISKGLTNFQIILTD